MCGIAGVFRWKGARGNGDGGASADRRAVVRMVERISHRGPDGSSVWASADGRCVLGQSLLAVMDRDASPQPLTSEDGRIRLVLNGEIYNFGDLRARLTRRGHAFRTSGDAEVVVHGYEEWGEAVVDRLAGMFALALWDGGEGRLLLARDGAGMKPLFVHRGDDAWIFGSEIGAVAAHPDVDASVDPTAVPLYLACGYVPSPRTFHRSIEKHAAGASSAVDGGGRARSRRFRSVVFASSESDPARGVEDRGRRVHADPAGRFRELLEEAVHRRLEADVPIGALLSGGIDSTVVVGLMSRITGERPETFSVGFDGAPLYDESEFARMAARSLGARNHEIRIGPSSIERLDDVVEAYGEPFGDSSALAMYLLTEEVGSRCTVALTGEGGDDVLAGYPRFLGTVLAQRIPGWIASIGRTVGGALPHQRDFRSFSRRFSRFFEAAALPPTERMLHWVGFFHDDALEALLGTGGAESGSSDDDAGAIVEAFRHATMEAESGASALGSPGRIEGTSVGRRSALAEALTLNFHSYLLDDLLVKADRCSMAHALELRCPFLDSEVVDFCAALPDRLRIRFREQKVLLRRAFRDMVPQPILERPKWGFGVPVPEWLRDEWRPLVEERLLAPDALIGEWIRLDAVETLWRRHLAGDEDHGHRIWALLTLESWLRRLPESSEG